MASAAAVASGGEVATSRGHRQHHRRHAPHRGRHGNGRRENAIAVRHRARRHEDAAREPTRLSPESLFEHGIRGH